ncbi:MAG: hypothetical protein DIU52_012395 [bacterium]
MLLGATALVVLPPRAAWAQKPEPSMVSAVIAAFAEPGRRIYLAPGLELSQRDREFGLVGRARHTRATLEEVQQRFGATIAYPEEAIQCRDKSRPETCRIPGDGIVFHFMNPQQPIQNGILPVRVTLYHNGRGEAGQILRETWDLLVRRGSDGWTVVQKRLAARANGPA